MTTMIRYLGRQAGPVPYFGIVTHKQYRFGRWQPVQLVDDRDVDGFLSLYEGRKQAFTLAEVEIDDGDKPATQGDAQPSTEMAGELAEPFDFTQLSGIGPARFVALREHDITTKAQFMELSPDALAEVCNVVVSVAVSWLEQIARL